MKKRISIVIPCYYSAKTIGKVLSGISETMRNHDYENYEVILVNDGSTDDTFAIISDYAKKDAHIVAADLSRNFGQHSALMAAYSLVTGDYVLGMDDDGEHNPADMFKLIEKLEEGYDYVCAEFGRDSERALYKRLGSQINDWMVTTCIGKPKDAIFSSYYVMRRYVVDEIVKSQNPHPYVGGMIVSVTKKLASVPIQHCSRLSGQSGYHLKNSIALWVNGVTAYSVIPLRVATLLGTCFSVLGFLLGIYHIIRKLIYPDILAGFTTIIACVLIVGGVNMLLMGMIGEYVGRIYMLNNQIPQYVIKTICRKEASDFKNNSVVMEKDAVGV